MACGCVNFGTPHYLCGKRSKLQVASASVDYCEVDFTL